MSSMNILFNGEHDDFSSLYWIPKYDLNQYKERYTAGASTCKHGEETEVFTVFQVVAVWEELDYFVDGVIFFLLD